MRVLVNDDELDEWIEILKKSQASEADKFYLIGQWRSILNSLPGKTVCLSCGGDKKDHLNYCYDCQKGRKKYFKKQYYIKMGWDTSKLED